LRIPVSILAALSVHYGPLMHTSYVNDDTPTASLATGSSDVTVDRLITDALKIIVSSSSLREQRRASVNSELITNVPLHVINC
jgi:hypothetical protein